MNRHAMLPLLLLACGVDPDATHALPADQAPVPVYMDLTYDHDLIKGESSVVTVVDAPPGRNVFLLATGAINAPGACPPALAPDCLEVGNPYVILGTEVADASGLATFTFNVPAAVPVDTAKLQAAAVVGRTHYVSDAPLVAIVDPPTATTIPAIRAGQHPLGAYLELNGVVTAVRSTGFTLQGQTQANDGIFIFNPNGPQPAPGDLVRVAGETELYDNNGALVAPADTLLELVLAVDGGFWEPMGTAPLPAPRRFTPTQLQDPALLESMESMLIEVEDTVPLVVLTDPFGIGAFSEFSVARGPGAAAVVIDNEYFNLPSALPTLSVGDSFDGFVGVLHFSFDAYKVAVRSSLDAPGFVDVP